MNAQNKLIFAATLLLAMLSVVQVARTEPSLSSKIKEWKENSNKIPEEKMSVVDKFGTMVAKNHVENFEETISHKITIPFVKKLMYELYYADELPDFYDVREATRVSVAENYFNKVDVDNIVKEFDSKNELSSFQLDGKSLRFAQFLYEKVAGPCDAFIGLVIRPLDSFSFYVEYSADFAKEVEERGAESEVKQFVHNFALYQVCRRTREHFTYAPKFKESLEMDLHAYAEDYKIYSELNPQTQNEMFVVETFGTTVAKNHVENFEEIISDKITIYFVKKCRTILYPYKIYDHMLDIPYEGTTFYFYKNDIDNILKEFSKNESPSLSGKTFVEFLTDNVEMPCHNYVKKFKIFFDSFSEYVKNGGFVYDLKECDTDGKVKELIRSWVLYIVCSRTLHYIKGD